MLKTLLSSALLLAVSAGLVSAGSVLVQNGAIASGTQRLATANGAVLDAGTGYVSSGTFSMSDADIGASPLTPDLVAALAADFKEFGSGVVGQGAFDIPGLFSVNTQTANLQAGDDFVGNPIFAVIGNGGDIAGSQSLLVYKTPSTADTPNFGPDAPAFSATVDLSTATDTDLLQGSVGGPAETIFNGNPITSADSLALQAVVPEPSVGLLALTGVFALAFRRRR